MITISQLIGQFLLDVPEGKVGGSDTTGGSAAARGHTCRGYGSLPTEREAMGRQE